MTTITSHVDATGRVFTMLPAGAQVSRCFVDNVFALQFFDVEGLPEVHFNGEFTVAQGGHQQVYTVASLVDLGGALTLMGKCVRQAMCWESGRLVIDFQDNTTVVVEPQEAYEAWELVNDTGVRFIALPGGGLAIWDAVPPGEQA